MDKMLYVAMSGAKQNMQSLSITANNLANSKTTGFKADLAQARSMQAFGEGLPSRVFSMTEIASQNFDTGSRITTGRTLDVAIEGDGWIAVQAVAMGRSGTQVGLATINSNFTDEAYTRDGHFRVTDEGILETTNGEIVLGEDGPITIPLPVNNIRITKNGTIMVQPEGAQATIQDEVARLKLVNPDVRELQKGADGLFRRKDGKESDADINVKVQSGALESSNVNPVYEMTKMISLQRQFEMQLKLMKTAEENDSSAAALLRPY
jgi:flagellar basal-body rod protein FlgF